MRLIGEAVKGLCDHHRHHRHHRHRISSPNKGMGEWRQGWERVIGPAALDAGPRKIKTPRSLCLCTLPTCLCAR